MTTLNKKIFDLPQIEMNIDELINFGRDLMSQFEKYAKKYGNYRIKLELQNKIRCNGYDCIKYDSYKYNADNKYLCWYHAYTH